MTYGESVLDRGLAVVPDLVFKVNVLTPKYGLFARKDI
jgi:hypothetical protein